MKRHAALFASATLGLLASFVGVHGHPALAGNWPAQRTGYVKPVSFDNVSFSYGSSLAAAVIGHQAPAYDFLGAGTVPSHIEFMFNGYILPRDNHLVGVAVYPLQSPTGGNTIIQDQANRLRSLLRQRPVLSAQRDLPYLPPIEAAEMFHAKEAYVNFQNGAGISYLTYFTQAAATVTNAMPVVYTFQGLTNDGKAYVSIQFPLFVPFLPNAAPSQSAGSLDAAHFDAYVRALVARLNRLPDDQYVPHLTYLGTLARSVDAMPTFSGPPTVILDVVAGSQGYTGANLRAQPSKQSALLTLIPNAASVLADPQTVRGDGASWYRVTYKGQSGYVLASLLRISECAC